MTVNSNSSSSPKTELRQALRSRLKAAPAEASHHASLNQRLLSLIRSLHGTAPQGIWAGFAAIDFEPDILPTMRALANQVEWALPRVEKNHLAFYLVDDFTTLLRNRFGILEPNPERARGGPIAVENFGGMLIPGVAFDRFGNRLGRGRGYYDRALAAFDIDKNRTIKIGVGFENQISAEAIPTESFDRPMDWVVTEAHAYCCGPRHS